MRKKLDEMAIKLYGGRRNQVVGVPHLKWGSALIRWNNTVEGEVKDYRLTGGCVFRETFSQPLVNLKLLECLTGADEPVNFLLYEFSGRSEGEDPP